MQDDSENIKKFLDNLPDNYDLLEEGIDKKVHEEYVGYSGSFGTSELEKKEIMVLGKALQYPNGDHVMKKRALVILAHTGMITAFRQIEAYYKNPDKELRQWAALALQECKMFIESALLEESRGFISTGLGGKGDRLRYYFLVLPLTDETFSSTQKKILKDEFSQACKNLNSMMEMMDLTDKYAGFTVLVPMDVAIGSVIDTGIKNCNEMGEFVFGYYYVTNQDIPDADEIEKAIAIVRGDEEPPELY